MELDATVFVSTWPLVDTIRSQPAAIKPRLPVMAEYRSELGG
jgi:hypothetical protein